ncbi:uncharacterized protein LOC142101447 [Mixophyes fleayi]|uniref:uncharacterized protein LOC142101447 n=1 Tax=Mixophyes fleayi TaxID=3061075 RepID=UPI003F4DFF65
MSPYLQLCKLSLVFLLLHSVAQTDGKINLVVTQLEVHKAVTGESVTISCSFVSRSPPYIVRWSLGCDKSVLLCDLPYYKNRINVSTPIDTKNDLTSYEVQISITIANLTENDSGTFCCHVHNHGEEGTGNGTRLEVTTRLYPSVQQDLVLKRFILYIIVGIETCLMLILSALVIKYCLQGSSRAKDQDNEEELEYEPGLHYAEICKKNPSQVRDRRSEQRVTYAPVRLHK